MGDGATFVLCVGSPLQENVMFSLKGKMLVVLPLYFVFTFKVAFVHLPVYTKSYIWDTFSIIKCYHF